MDLLDASQLAKELSPMLIPLLPYLVKGMKISGQELAKALGKKIGEKIPDAIVDLWNKLDQKFKNKPGAFDVIQRAIDTPQDGRLATLLEVQLEEILVEEKFRKEILGLLAKAEDDGASINQIIQVGKLSGELIGVEVDSIESLKDGGIKKVDQQIFVKNAKSGSKISGITLRDKKKKK